jgi:hypothetical protein
MVVERAIPAELEGLDEDIAREIMQEIPEQEVGEPDAVIQPDEPEVPAEEEEVPVAPEDEEAEEEIEEAEKKVPYAALKEERGKRKAAQASIGALEQKLNEIQAQLNQPKAPPPQQAEEEGEQKSYYDFVYDAAEDRRYDDRRLCDRSQYGLCLCQSGVSDCSRASDGCN